MALWQVYRKIESPDWGGRHQWIAYGLPTTKEVAEAIVAELWVPIIEMHKKKAKKVRVGYNEPHCVPI